MNLTLSITIPTHNRALYLRECLESMLPQTVGKPVEVVVIDNASTDATPEVIAEYAAKYPNIRSYRNQHNLGYAGNQAKCIEYARGDYIAILCDDDVYLSGAVDAILCVMRQKEYAFIAINYCSFIRNPDKPVQKHVAPIEDKEFSRAFDVLKHPSVGHFSGLIFNARLSKAALTNFLVNHKLGDYERLRGILGELYIRSLFGATLPSFFIGLPLMGARMPLVVDYDSLQHLCIDSYECFLQQYAEGLINESDLAFFRGYVIRSLPRALYRNGCFFNDIQIDRLKNKLEEWFGDDPDYLCNVAPILVRLRYVPLRLFMRGVVRMYKTIKPFWWNIQGLTAALRR